MSKLALNLIRYYQKYISWIWGPAVCRFDPTCSQFTYNSIVKYGIMKGGWMGLKQIINCHPFSRG